MRLTDVDALIEKFERDTFDRIRNDYQSGFNDGMFHAEVVVDNFPTVDAEPVIRCEYCKLNPEKGLGCPMAGSAERNDDSFCSWAVRKEK